MWPTKVRVQGRAGGERQRRSHACPAKGDKLTGEATLTHSRQTLGSLPYQARERTLQPVNVNLHVFTRAAQTSVPFSLLFKPQINLAVPRSVVWDYYLGGKMETHFTCPTKTLKNVFLVLPSLYSKSPLFLAHPWDCSFLTTHILSHS